MGFPSTTNKTNYHTWQYRKPSIKPPLLQISSLSNKPSLFRERKLITSPALRHSRQKQTLLQGEREHLPKKPMKIVSARFLRVWNFPIGSEAPEGISCSIRWENCQPKKTQVHLQKKKMYYMDKAVKVLYYTTNWYNWISDLGGHFNLVKWANVAII